MLWHDVDVNNGYVISDHRSNQYLTLQCPVGALERG